MVDVVIRVRVFRAVVGVVVVAVDGGQRQPVIVIAIDADLLSGTAAVGGPSCRAGDRDQPGQDRDERRDKNQSSTHVVSNLVEWKGGEIGASRSRRCGDECTPFLVATIGHRAESAAFGGPSCGDDGGKPARPAALRAMTLCQPPRSRTRSTAIGMTT